MIELLFYASFGAAGLVWLVAAAAQLVLGLKRRRWRAAGSTAAAAGAALTLAFPLMLLAASLRAILPPAVTRALEGDVAAALMLAAWVAGAACGGVALARARRAAVSVPPEDRR